jgi:hypothetical protein
MYVITIHKLTGENDATDSRFECTTETHGQAIELFDCLTRGIQGHYRAWLRDNIKYQIVKESQVTYK